MPTAWLCIYRELADTGLPLGEILPGREPLPWHSWVTNSLLFRRSSGGGGTFEVVVLGVAFDSDEGPRFIGTCVQHGPTTQVPRSFQVRRAEPAGRFHGELLLDDDEGFRSEFDR